MKTSTVLLVEDDNFLRDIIHKRLENEGFKVIKAEDGDQALLEINQSNFDIVLLDIILPNVNGFEVLAKIKNHENEKIQNIPVIMLSNLGQESDIEKAMSMGASNYLIKAHFTTDEIIEKIKQELGK